MKLQTILTSIALIALGCGPIKPSKEANSKAPSSESPAPETGTSIAPPKSVEKTTKFTVNLQLSTLADLTGDRQVTWTDVKPIFERSCVGCHNDPEDFNLSAWPFESVNWTNSEELTDAIIVAINETNEDFRMPYGEDPLPESEIKLIEKWKNDGLAAAAPNGVDEMVDLAVMEVIYKDQTKVFELKKQKSQGLYSFVEEKFPMFAKSVTIKVYKAGALINQIKFDNFTTGNGKLNVNLNI